MIGFQYVVCRYVADVVRDEPVNIGVILHSHSEGFTDCVFSRAFASKALVRKDPDLEVLLAIVDDLEERFQYTGNLVFTDMEARDLRDPGLLARLSEHYCNQVQFAQPRAYVSHDLAEAKEYLYRMLVATPKDHRPQSYSSAWVRRQLQRLIQQRGVQNKVKSQVVLMDHWGAPINLDFQWQNGAANFVQALSLNDQREGETLSKARLWYGNFEQVRRMNEYTNAGIATVVYPPVRPTKSYDTALRILRDQSDVVELSQAVTVVEKIADYGHPLQ